MTSRTDTRTNHRWEQHLAQRNTELADEVRRLRGLLAQQRRRAEHWKHRALEQAKR